VINTAWPVAIRLVDVAAPLQPLSGLTGYPRVRLFVTHGASMIGTFDLETGGVDSVRVERLRDAIAKELGARLYERALAAQLAGAPAPPLRPTSVSIIVPSCDREQDLRRCLESLTRQNTRHFVEVIVVDNRPNAATARRVAGQFPSVRIVDEPRPGLSFARNTGIRHATGEIIVATDDDVVVPADWIEKLLEPFVDAHVQAVTGQVLPLELETRAQFLFEAYGGLGKGFVTREFDKTWFDSLSSAVPTWIIGATANAAFRATMFSDPAIGLLDEALGAGTPTGCSEDTYLFYRILKAGGTIVYSPHAFVWHRHRDSIASGRQQIYAYSKGHVAYHLTTWLRDGDRRAFVRLLYSLPRAHLSRSVARLRRRTPYPLAMILIEIAGNCAGPLALWRSRRRARLLGPGATNPEPPHAVSVDRQSPEDPAHESVVASVPRLARGDGGQLQPPP
jgi:GT2 family glycosyltransferase